MASLLIFLFPFCIFAQNVCPKSSWGGGYEVFDLYVCIFGAGIQPVISVTTYGYGNLALLNSDTMTHTVVFTGPNFPIFAANQPQCYNANKTCVLPSGGGAAMQAYPPNGQSITFFDLQSKTGGEIVAFYN